MVLSCEEADVVYAKGAYMGFNLSNTGSLSVM